MGETANGAAGGRWRQRLALASSRSVVRRALGYAVVVGSVLAAINHGDALLRGDVSQERWLRIALTYLVPYLVSTFSSVGAMVHGGRPGPDDGP